MPATPHIEKHFTATGSVRDVVIGMADGLTVPFALAAGLSAAVTSTDVIVTAGLAEVVAGAIAMGLGGYLAARTDAEHYAAEEQREHREIDQLREREIEEVEQIFREYGLAGDALKSVVGAVSANRQRWVDFMMRFELGLERPDPKRAPLSAATIGGSYVVGGLIPLVPYMFTQNIGTALQISGRDWRRPALLRSRQRTLHRRQQDQVCPADVAGRRIGRRSSVLARPPVRIGPVPSSFSHLEGQKRSAPTRYPRLISQMTAPMQMTPIM